MIDIRKLKELVKLMVANDLSEMDLRDNEDQVTIRRAGIEPPQIITSAAPQALANMAPAAHAAGGGGAATAIAEPPAAAPGGDSGNDANLIKIESPMVGTFYASPNPDSPAFVKTGDSIDSESVVCIIEAMKIFNEIKAECSGTIEKILVKNGEAVEFGQPLFLVNPE